MIKTMEAMNLDHYIKDSHHLGTVVHLDFNNANILISTEQKPIIIDLDRAHISPQVCDFHLLLPTLLKMGAKVENLYQLLELILLFTQILENIN